MFASRPLDFADLAPLDSWPESTSFGAGDLAKIHAEPRIYVGPSEPLDASPDLVSAALAFLGEFSGDSANLPPGPSGLPWPDPDLLRAQLREPSGVLARAAAIPCASLLLVIAEGGRLSPREAGKQRHEQQIALFFDLLAAHWADPSHPGPDHALWSHAGRFALGVASHERNGREGLPPRPSCFWAARQLFWLGLGSDEQAARLISCALGDGPQADAELGLLLGARHGVRTAAELRATLQASSTAGCATSRNEDGVAEAFERHSRRL